MRGLRWIGMLVMCLVGRVAAAQTTPCTAETCADLRLETRPLATVLIAGAPTTFEVNISNMGPAPARAKVEDALPAGLDATWTCVAMQGAQCGAPQGMTSIAETVTLPMGGALRYILVWRSDPCGRGPTGAMNSAKVTALDRTDPELSNNEDRRTVTATRPEVQLALTVDDGKTTATAGETTRYTVRATNHGISCAKGLTVAAPTVAGLSNVTWTCAGEGGATCGAARGAGELRDVASAAPPGSRLTYTVAATVAPGFSGALTYAATAVHVEPEFNADDRVSAADTTTVAPGRPLDCSAARASVETIWPPSHAMVPVAVTGTPAPARITSIQQDEPADAVADGSTGDDATLLPDGKAEVRAERAATGDGRVYHLGFQATDPSGARCQGIVKTCVPKAEGQTCGDGGAAHASLSAPLPRPKLPVKIPPIRR